jgi:signal transduction histidine kinase
MVRPGRARRNGTWPGRRRRRLGSIRVRAALLATLVTAVAFGGGALWQRHALYQNRLDAAVQQAATAAYTVSDMVMSDGGLVTITSMADPNRFTSNDWAVLLDNQVVATTGALAPYFPVSGPTVRLSPATLTPHGDKVVTFDLTASPGPGPLDGSTGRLAVAQMSLSGEMLRAMTRPPAGWPVGAAVRWPPVGPHTPLPQITVYTLATPYEAQATVAAVDRTLVLGLPVAALLMGCLAWLVAGRALRPVEAIRAELADITDRDLDRRVPVPPSGDEIGRLAVTTNATLDRLHAAVEQQRQFIADAAHELRSPLAGLRNELEVAVAHPDPATWPDAAAAALRSAKRLQALTDDLLTLARTDRPVSPATDLVDLTALVDEQIAERAYLNPGGPEFTTAPADAAAPTGEPATAAEPVTAGRVAPGDADGPAESVAVPGDESQLGRLLRNLLDNAARHAAGTVTVSLRPAGASVLLEVGDDGPGIPAADRERVFGRFTRLDDDRSRDHGGTGLGLAIVAGIAARHGGDVHIADSDRGARVVVRLPVTPPPVPGRGRPGRPRPVGGTVRARPAARRSGPVGRGPQQVDERAVGGQPVDVVQLVRGQPAQRPVLAGAGLAGGDPAGPDPQDAGAALDG